MLLETHPEIYRVKHSLQYCKSKNVSTLFLGPPMRTGLNMYWQNGTAKKTPLQDVVVTQTALGCSMAAVSARLHR